MSAKHKKLNEIFATAICGNDILSSTLYVSGVAIIFAGIYAPLVLLFIGVVLYLYKFVYTEVVEALPINGGAYNCLLNGTSKMFAAIAGVTTFLSYIATAVISAKVSQEYLSVIFPIPVIVTTILLLGLFSLLVISGIKDSAKVALGIFIFHIVTLTVFSAWGAHYILTSHTSFSINQVATTSIIEGKGVIKAIFLGFSASLLGVSGFESSANFVEEQKKGVFRKTLRNMLIGVVIFNPIIAYIVLHALPIEGIAQAKDFLLAEAAFQIGGTFLKTLVVIDAVLVLAGAVLTSFVGVSGLLFRMAADSVLPNFLTKQNSKNAHPRIIWSFFVLCSLILLITKGDLLSLAGLYTISFLGVMSMFAFGNLILKFTRPELKRTYNASVLVVFLAFLTTSSGIVGNITINPENLYYFSLYFFPTLVLVLFVVHEDYILRFLLKATRHLPKIHEYLFNHFRSITRGRLLVFIRSPNHIHNLLRYINRNETGRNVVLVYCGEKKKRNEDKMYKKIKAIIPYLKEAGVYPHLNINLDYSSDKFGPKVIQKYAKKYNIRENRIMVGSIKHRHTFDYDDLGGVRIIF